MKPTKPFLELPLESRRCPLPPTWRVKDVVDAARSAALGFAWGANHWERRDLARWLAGPYAHALAPTRHIRRPPGPRVVRDEPIPAAHIQELLVRAHTRTVELLRDVGSWCSDAFTARSAVDAGLVVGVSDDAGGIGFAPAATPYMRLVDRVQSLFLADFLTRPHEYTSFGVCEACEAVTFEANALHEGCTNVGFVVEAPPSRVVLRRRPTLVGVGAEAPRTLILPWQDEETDSLTG